MSARARARHSYPPLEGESKADLRAFHAKTASGGGHASELPLPDPSALRFDGSTLPQGEGGNELQAQKAPWLAVLVFFFLFSTSGLARADDLVSGLSTDLIQITSNFTGTDIVLFGAIEATEQAGPAKDQDLVIVIRGPQVDMTVRRKARILGIWVNREQTVLTGLPGYYFLASTRPLDDIASIATQQRFRLGTLNLESGTIGGMKPDEAAAFRAAAIRDRKREHLYWESPTGIEFLSRTLFRARIPVPASVPPGEYRAEAYLFQNGTVVSAQSSPLFIDKSGFERQVYNYAYQASFAYGFVAVLMAFAFGWAGFVVFRDK